MLRQVIWKLLLNNNEFVSEYYLSERYFVRNKSLDTNRDVFHGIQQDDRVLRELHFDRLNHCWINVLILIDELLHEDVLNEFEDEDQHLYIHHELELYDKYLN